MLTTIVGVGRQVLLALAVAAISMPFTVADAAAAAPGNDAFDAPTVLGGPLPFAVTASTVEATREPGEPDHGGGGGEASVWFAWTAETSGRVVVETCGSDFDTLLGVYVGDDLAALAPVVANDNAGECRQVGGPSKALVEAVAGTTYRIAVDGSFGETGHVDLAIRAARPPANDDFASAEVVEGPLPVEIAGTTVESTIEPGEPAHAGSSAGAAGNSVWYRYTPAVSGWITVDTCGSLGSTLLGVYTGDDLDALAAVASSRGFRGCGDTIARSRATLAVVAGETYAFAIAGFAGSGFATTLTIREADPPANDAFAAPETVGGTLPLLAEGSTVDATREHGEPAHAGRLGVGSIWYSWTPSVSEPVRVETCASTFDTLLAVYTGDALDALAEVASNDNTTSCPYGGRSQVTFEAVAGTTYRIAVDGPGAAYEYVDLAIWPDAPVPGPANDAFAAATVLAGAVPTSATGTNVAATEEPGEPDHAGNAGGRSIWFRWTPAASGPVTVDTCASGFDTLLAAYTGDDLGALSPVASNDDTRTCASFGRSSISFTAVAGTTYHLAVDGYAGASGDVGIAVSLAQPPPAPANDAFGASTTLAGDLPLTVRGTTVGATKEAGEPRHASRSGAASVWYSWTATQTGLVSIGTCAAASFDTVLAVYTGDAVAALAPVAAADDGCGTRSLVRFTASAGTTYRIAVDGFSATAAGTFTLEIRMPPAHDFFDSAQIVAGPLPRHVTGTSEGGTRETGEPIHAGNGRDGSFWYRWTAAVEGPVAIETCTGGADTQVAVYTGSVVGALTPVAANDDGCGTRSRVVIDADAGETYSIAVTTTGPWVSTFTLTFRRIQSPPGDSRADAVVLDGLLPIERTIHTGDATRESGEPAHAGQRGGASVWYRWTAPLEATAMLDLCGSDFDTLVGVYTDTGVTGLEEVAANDDGCVSSGPEIRGSRARFAVEAGTTYWIAVDGWEGATGTAVLALRLAPANDDFAGSRVLTGDLPITVRGDNVDAWHEAGEPEHFGDGPWASVWYSWTAPSSGPVLVDSCGSQFATVMGIYTGDSVDALTDTWPAQAHGHSCDGGPWTGYVLDAVAGTTYHVALDNSVYDVGPVVLTIRPADRPVNDDFADAAVLAGPLPLAATGTVEQATAEPGEPGFAPSHTIWYRWTAPADGPVTVETCGSEAGYPTVFTGADLETLTPLASTAGECEDGRASRFAASAGETYSIAIDDHFRTGAVRLVLRPAVVPDNDAFAAASVLPAALPIEVAGSTMDATDEPFEPHGSDASSVWYRWTPSTSGTVHIEACDAGFFATVAVYTGSGVHGLTPVTSDSATPGCGDYRPSATFEVSAGQTYTIAVVGGWSPFTLRLRAANPPANDDFAAASLIGAGDPLPTTIRGTNLDATAERGEPGAGWWTPAEASVWFTWTPAASGLVTIDGCDSRFPAVVTAHTGTTLTGLTPAGRVVRPCAGGQAIELDAVAGTTYHLALDGVAGETGRFALRFRPASRPDNDDLAHATVLPAALPIAVEGTNAGATLEPREYPHGYAFGRTSVWYEWTPATTGPVVVDACESSFTPDVAVYTGASHDLHHETLVADGACRLRFEAFAGQTYRIAVDGSDGDTGSIVLALRHPPANDDSGSATVLTGAGRRSIRTSNLDASTEVGEPAHGGQVAMASLWYEWTPSSSGLVRIGTCSSGVDSRIAVYTGTALNRLTDVASDGDACGDDGRVTFAATAGTTYRIAVDSAEPGRIDLAIEPDRSR